MKFHGRFLLWAYQVVFYLFIAAPILTGCGNDTAAYNPQNEYVLACADAAVVTPDEISRHLTAITPDNKSLIWENGVVGSRVLVVSWVNQEVCDMYSCPAGGCRADDTCKEGRECQYSRDTYVTVVPELKTFFKTAPATSMRIAQLLGLPPSDAQNKTCFLEMWVAPKDLFRPTPDPEITDHEAEIDFPGDQFASPFRRYDDSELAFADLACDSDHCTACTQSGQCGFTDYKSFFRNRTKYIYTSNNPYPWTRLGYTYDWGNPDNHIGLSEFVIHGKKADGSTISVRIKAVTPTAAYFTD